MSSKKPKGVQIRAHPQKRNAVGRAARSSRQQQTRSRVEEANTCCAQSRKVQGYRLTHLWYTISGSTFENPKSHHPFDPYAGWRVT